MVYLIHFEKKLHHTQHYIGFVEGDLGQRIALHKMSRGAKLLAAINELGIEWHVVRTWRGQIAALNESSRTTKRPAAFALFVVATSNHQPYFFTLK